jgi:hypothetical protein
MAKRSKSLAVVALWLLMAGSCTKKPPPGPVDAGGTAVLLPPPPPGPKGTIQGTAALLGAAPKMGLLNRAADSFCARNPAHDEEVLVGPAGMLRNVVVRIREGVRYAYPVPEKTLEVKQVNCTYLPRVQVGVLGQEIAIYNNDPILHNVNTFKGTAQWFNRPQPAIAGLPPIRKKLENGMGLVTFKCDIHPWMRAYIAVAPHPFSAVTADDGAFALRDVPPGTYTVEAWHERYGTKTAVVKVEAQKTAEVKFHFGG